MESPWNNNKKSMFSQTQNQINDFFNNFGGLNVKLLAYILIGVTTLWFLSGIYEINEGDESIVLRFGKFVRRGFPGLNYHLPSPIESVIIDKVNKSRVVEIGYRSSNRVAGEAKYINNESNMLTKDEKIVDLNCNIMWHIKDFADFAFNVSNPADAVKAIAESVIREVIGNTEISSVLSDQKHEITSKIEALTQKILDTYGAGVKIEAVQLLKAEPPSEVVSSYRSVQVARSDKDKKINEARGYENDIIPKARGEASRITQEAEGYKREVISRATGDAARFSMVLRQYSGSDKPLMRERLYLDTMYEILNGSNKVITERGVLPHFPINLIPQNK